MKNKLTLLLFFILSTFVSCEKDTIDTNINLDSYQTFNLQRDSITETSNELELHSQWVSYLLTKIFMDKNARVRVENYLSTHNTNVIKLHTIIGNDLNTINFRGLFIELLEYEIQPYRPEPDWEKDKPGSLIPPPPGRFLKTEENPVSQFMNFVLAENCIEIYFPNGLNVNGFNSDRFSGIISTAHPLNNNNFNLGIKRYFILQQIAGEIGYITQFVDVTNNTPETIIVARPYRVSSINNENTCEYSQYPDIDFRDFLK